jgi:hypothetical protein
MTIEEKYQKLLRFVYLLSIDRLCLRDYIFDEAKKILKEIGEIENEKN